MTVSTFNLGSEENASAVQKRLLAVWVEFEAIVDFGYEQVGTEQNRPFREAILNLNGRMAMDVLGPLYEAYPGICPEGWGNGR